MKSSRMKTLVYFAGSIRGGRTDAALYSRMIDYIKNYAVVLTEHIGNPHLNVIEHAQRDEEIYSHDMLIGECTTPSLGVGYELASAEQLGKPCHILYDRTKTHLSAMLTGNPYFQIHPYVSEEEIYQILDSILA